FRDFPTRSGPRWVHREKKGEGPKSPPSASDCSSCSWLRAGVRVEHDVGVTIAAGTRLLREHPFLPRIARVAEGRGPGSADQVVLAAVDGRRRGICRGRSGDIVAQAG